MLIYKTAYGAYLALVLAVLAKQIYLREKLSMPEIIPLCLYAFAVMFALIAVVTLERISARLVWTGTLSLYALFTWYSWYSLEAPFQLHEVHSFDAAAIGHERLMHYLLAGPIFALLSVWLLSLPIIKARGDRRTERPS